MPLLKKYIIDGQIFLYLMTELFRAAKTRVYLPDLEVISKMIKRILISLLIFISLHWTAPAQLFSADVGKRPKIGVVLSGGGAKGFAHIAVLRRLEELKIPVDYIGGTSMGSIIAALYAMGYTVDELEAIARDTDWTRYFENKPERDNTNLIQKLYFHEYPFNLNITKDGISAPRGLVNGQKTGLFLSRLSWGAQYIKDYSELPIPFICVATDFESGTGTVFDKGILAQSLRASMAIPSVFDPVEIDGKVYLDGGVVNNFPVREVKKMGADIIIGVDVSSRLYKQEDLTSAPVIMEQAISFLGESKTMKQRELCDILILPQVNKYSALDFESTDEIIKKGDEAVLQQMDKLKILSGQMSVFDNPERGRAILNGEDTGIIISRIEFHNLRMVSKKVITQYLNIEKGEKVTVDKIEKSINTIYGLNFFERIHYNIDRDGDDNVLHLYFEENSESHLNFGISFDSDLQGALLTGFEIRNLVFKNTETIIKARIGEYSNIDLTYLIYTSFDPGVWIDVNANVYNMDFYVYEGKNKIAVYDFWYSSSSLNLNFFNSNWLILSFGIRKEFFFIDADIAADPDRNNYKFDVLACTSIVKIDSMDRKYFPTCGLFIEAEFDYVRTDNSFHQDVLVDEPFKRHFIDAGAALPLWKRSAFHAGGAMSSVTSDQTPPSYWFALGGAQRYESWIFPLNGYEMMEKTDTHGWVYYADLQYEFYQNFFLIARWNEGKTVDNYNKLFEYNDTSAAYGLIAGYISPIGPIEGSIFKRTGSNDYAFHFSLGLLL
jgi:NTE family protein